MAEFFGVRPIDASITSKETPFQKQTNVPAQPASQWSAGLDTLLKQADDNVPLPVQFGRGELASCLTAGSFWLIYTVEKGGRLAIRTCFDPQTVQNIRLKKQTATTLDYQIDGSLGRFHVRVELAAQEPMLLRYTTTLTPAQPFSVQAFPRDLYALTSEFTPAGQVYVTQSGPTAGLAYLSMPEAGSLVYFQNLTALNTYCQLTHTDPSGCVAVNWPELGFALPATEQPLVAATDIVLSDAFVCLSGIIPQTEFEGADLFLEAIAAIYPHLPKPETVYYDWPSAAKRTIKALLEAPDCGRVIKGKFYVNAYVGASQKPPESMVQLAILVPLWEYQQWLGQPVPLVDKMQENIGSFFDEQKSTLMRWLPGEPFAEAAAERSEEQHYDKIDSWYLLHTLLNLGRLAEQGNMEARSLLIRSIDFVIRAAAHFGYDWPVFYDSRNLDVIKAETKEGAGGELDVAGLYTHVMLQVFELTKEARFLDEARRSAERLRGKGFSLLYQSNITIMSGLTLAKLWKLTGNRLYYNLSKLSIANVVARLWIWECDFGFGKDYSTFMGVAPLKDADYQAAYEEAEIFATIQHYLVEFGADLPAATRLLLAEYMKYLLHRGHSYFPAELPAAMICEQPREGYILRDLPIPLEDISTGWKPAGAVGQEVYGGALAYMLTTYAYKQLADVPVLIFCEYPIQRLDYQLTGKHSGYAAIQLGCTPESRCRLRLLAKGRQFLDVQLFNESVDHTQLPLPTSSEGKTYREYDVTGNARLRVQWGDDL